jgi:hypothetical protein
VIHVLSVYSKQRDLVSYGIERVHTPPSLPPFVELSRKADDNFTVSVVRHYGLSCCDTQAIHARHVINSSELIDSEVGSKYRTKTVHFSLSKAGGNVCITQYQYLAFTSAERIVRYITLTFFQHSTAHYGVCIQHPCTWHRNSFTHYWRDLDEECVSIIRKRNSKQLKSCWRSQLTVNFASQKYLPQNLQT